MGRPTDWSPVGWSHDPTPGRPDRVADLARRYRATAEAVRTAKQGLRRIEGNDSYKGDGGDELRRRARDLREQVAQIERRYDDAAAALETYHPEQHAAQLIADAALSRAVEAEELRDRATRTLDSLDRPSAPGEAEDPTVVAARASARRDQAHATTELQRACNDVRSAHDAQHRAGSTAANRLRKALDEDRLNDSLLDDALGVVKQIAHVAGIIAAFAGILSLFLGWIPVVGQILTAIALMASLVSLLSNLTLVATGKGEWDKVGWDLLSVATFGVGRVLAAGGKLASTAARGRAWVRARELVGTAVSSSTRYRRVRTMLGGPLAGADAAIPLATVGGLARAGLRAASPRTVLREAVEAGRHARQQWTSAGAVWGDVRQGLTAMSGGKVGGALAGLAGASGTEVRALGAIHASVRTDDAVQGAVWGARALAWSNAAPTLGGFALDGKNVVDLFTPPSVDPPREGVGSQDPGLPADFTQPSSHLSPTPAAP